MDNATWKSKTIRLLTSFLPIMATGTVLVLALTTATTPVSAGPVPSFGPACGKAIIDGNVHPDEWSNASTQTFQMVSPGGADPFAATLYVMNSGYYLYLGITINDDEFTTSAEFLPQGDSFRIDFDNDHSGTLFTPGDDVLSLTAAPPQFSDNYILSGTSTQSDILGGGRTDGIGAASRVGDLNHFELRHPLCSGDALDFCLHQTDTVGFRLEYLDAEANGTYGGSQFFPGSSASSEADIVISPCSVADAFMLMPLIMK